MLQPRIASTLLRLTPIIAIVVAAGVFIIRAEQGGPHVWRNLGPAVLCLALFWVALLKNRGSWFAVDRRWTPAAIGFAIPTLGLSLYLHASWHYDFDGIASGAATPDLMFRFLPYYTLSAGCIGFAIGWVIGRNIPATK